MYETCNQLIADATISNNRFWVIDHGIQTSLQALVASMISRRKNVRLMITVYTE